MDSIKKKMQSMKLEKENAMDRADQAEQKTKELEDKLKLVSAACSINHANCTGDPESPRTHAWWFVFVDSKAEEENTSLMKRISQLDTDLDKAQEQLSEANTKLDEAAKKSADVSVNITNT